MKPFNLQKALDGEPVVTRSGEKVSGLRVASVARYPINGFVSGEWLTWAETGESIRGREGSLDLFMADTQPPDYAIPAEATGIEAELCRMFTERQAFGIKKYGVTVEDNPLSLREWLHHALMESMDHCVYLLRAIKELDSN